MPLYNFATYADMREEWAIRADSLDKAKNLIGDDANGDWLEDAIRVDTEAVECRSEFVPGDDDDRPAINEITPDHWAWREAHREYIEHSLRQNIAAISGEFHTHHLSGPFYDRFGTYIDGFVGHYELCIAMAEAMTDWEVANGLGEAYENAGVLWIELVEDLVETVLVEALYDRAIPDPAKILPTLRVLAGRPS